MRSARRDGPRGRESMHRWRRARLASVVAPLLAASQPQPTTPHEPTMSSGHNHRGVLPTAISASVVGEPVTVRGSLSQHVGTSPTLLG